MPLTEIDFTEMIMTPEKAANYLRRIARNDDRFEAAALRVIQDAFAAGKRSTLNFRGRIEPAPYEPETDE